MASTLSVVGNNGINFEYWFDQLIDHNNPSAGTFKQRYFFSDQYWTGDGAPIILQTPGETSAEGWWSQLQTGYIQNKMMGQLGAAGVILERQSRSLRRLGPGSDCPPLRPDRYWGKSLPVPDLTTQNLQWLTVEQGVEDLKVCRQHRLKNAALGLTAQPHPPTSTLSRMSNSRSTSHLHSQIEPHGLTSVADTGEIGPRCL